MQKEKIMWETLISKLFYIIRKSPVPITKNTQHFSITKIKWLMPLEGITEVRKHTVWPKRKITEV
jgi:hypothetical protein